MTCLIVCEPTHRAGKDLDLAWTKVDSAHAWVERGECMTSDHLPLCGHVPSRYDKESPKGPLRVPKEKLPLFAQAVSRWVRAPRTLESVEGFNAYVAEISRALTDGLKVCGKSLTRESGRSAPWWARQCRTTYLEYRKAGTEAMRKTCAKALRATVASAKREPWKMRVEAIRSTIDIFKLMQWSKPRLPKVPPRLLREGRLVSDQADRAVIL